MSELRSEAVSCSRSAVELKAVLTVEQPGGQQGVLLLWGAAVAWLPQFSKNKGTGPVSVVVGVSQLHQFISFYSRARMWG